MTSEDRFGYEWNKYNKVLPEFEIQFNKWTAILGKDGFKDKSVLDAGCGMGRNSLFALKNGAKNIVAFDNDEKSIQSAKDNLAFANIIPLKDSIYKIDYINEFDIVMCIGVIHHLEFPEAAIDKLIMAVKPNGKILIWVYGYEGNEWIVRYINPIRKITSKLPISITHFLSYWLSIPLWLYLKLIPQKSTYMNQLKLFHFKSVHAIVFDQLLPTIARYYKKEEAINLIRAHKDIEKVFIEPVNNNSWAVLGVKK